MDLAQRRRKPSDPVPLPSIQRNLRITNTHHATAPLGFVSADDVAAGPLLAVTE
jgi:hypothetical protein